MPPSCLWWAHADRCFAIATRWCVRCVRFMSFFFFFFFPQDIIDDYKRHVDWKSDDQPGGFEALNVRFIKEFVFLT